MSDPRRFACGGKSLEVRAEKTAGGWSFAVYEADRRVGPNASLTDETASDERSHGITADAVEDMKALLQNEYERLASGDHYTPDASPS